MTASGQSRCFEKVPRALVVAGAMLAIAIFLFVARLFPNLASAQPAVVLVRELLLLLLSAALVLFVLKVDRLPASALGRRPAQPHSDGDF